MTDNNNVPDKGPVSSGENMCHERHDEKSRRERIHRRLDEILSDRISDEDCDGLLALMESYIKEKKETSAEKTHSSEEPVFRESAVSEDIGVNVSEDRPEDSGSAAETPEVVSSQNTVFEDEVSPKLTEKPRALEDSADGFSSDIMNDTQTAGFSGNYSSGVNTEDARARRSSDGEFLEMITGKMIAGIGAAILLVIGFVMIARSIHFSFGPYARFFTMLAFSGVMIYFGGYKADRNEKALSIARLRLGRVTLSSIGFALLYVTMAAGFIYFDIVPGGSGAWICFLGLWTFMLTHMTFRRHGVFSLIAQTGVIGSIPLVSFMESNSFVFACMLIMLSQLPTIAVSIFRKHQWSFMCGSIGFAMVSLCAGAGFRTGSSGGMILALAVFGLIMLQKVMIIVNCYQTDESGHPDGENRFMTGVAASAGALLLSEFSGLLIIGKMFDSVIAYTAVIMSSFCILMVTDSLLSSLCRKEILRHRAGAVMNSLAVMLAVAGLTVPDYSLLIWGMALAFGIRFCIVSVIKSQTPNTSDVLCCTFLAIIYMMQMSMRHIMNADYGNVLPALCVVGGTAAVSAAAYYLHMVRTAEDRCGGGYVSVVECVNENIRNGLNQVFGEGASYFKYIGVNVLVILFFIFCSIWVLPSVRHYMYSDILWSAIIIFGVITLFLIKGADSPEDGTSMQKKVTGENTGYVKNESAGAAAAYSIAGGLTGFVMTLTGTAVGGHSVAENSLTGFTMLAAAFLPVFICLFGFARDRVKNLRLLVTAVSFAAVAMLAVCVENYLHWSCGLGLFAGICGLVALKHVGSSFASAPDRTVQNTVAQREDNSFFFSGIKIISVALVTCFYGFYGNHGFLSSHFHDSPAAGTAIWILYTVVLGICYFGDALKNFGRKLSPAAVTGYTTGMSVFLLLAVNGFFHTQTALVLALYILSVPVYFISLRYRSGVLNILSVLMLCAGSALVYRNVYPDWSESGRMLFNTATLTGTFGIWMLTCFGKNFRDGSVRYRLAADAGCFLMWFAMVIMAYSGHVHAGGSSAVSVPAALPLYWWVPVTGYLVFGVMKKHMLSLILAVCTIYLFVYAGLDDGWRNVANTLSYILVAGAVMLLVRPVYPKVYGFLLPGLVLIWMALFSLYDDFILHMTDRSDVYWSLPIIMYLAFTCIRKDLIPLVAAVIMIFFGYHFDSVPGCSLFTVFAYVITVWVMSVEMSGKYRIAHQVLSLVLLYALLVYYHDVREYGYVWILLIPACWHFLEALVTRCRFSFLKGAVLTVMGTLVISLGKYSDSFYYPMFFILPAVPVMLLVYRSVEKSRDTLYINLAAAAAALYVTASVMINAFDSGAAALQSFRDFISAYALKDIFEKGWIYVLTEYGFLYVPVLLGLLYVVFAVNRKADELRKPAPECFLDRQGLGWQMPLSAFAAGKTRYAEIISVFATSVYVKFLAVIMLACLARYLVHLGYALNLSLSGMTKTDFMSVFSHDSDSIKTWSGIGTLLAVTVCFAGAFFTRYTNTAACNAGKLRLVYGNSIEDFVDRGNLINRRMWYITEAVAMCGTFMGINYGITSHHFLALSAFAVSCMISVPVMFTDRKFIVQKYYYCIVKYFGFLLAACITLNLGTVVFTVLSLLSSAVMLVIGFRYRVPLVRRSGLFICIFCATKLIVFDVSYHTDITRALSVLFAGIVLLGISLLYNYFSRYVDENDRCRQDMQ